MKNELRKPAKRPPRLFDRVASIVEDARARVVRTVNTRMVMACWLIGREIVQEEQGGKKRAGYGDALLEDLSRRLTKRSWLNFCVAIGIWLFASSARFTESSAETHDQTTGRKSNERTHASIRCGRLHLAILHGG